jgi:iron complex transport system permease protein
LLVGPDHRVLLPASVLGGATLVMLADLLARTVVSPAQLPLGGSPR